MYNEYLDNLCPQCLLDDKKNILLLNNSDFFECPSCNLQISFREYPIATVLSFRGKGNFSKENKTIPEIDFGAGLAPMKMGSSLFLSTGALFTDESDFRKYIYSIRNEISDDFFDPIVISDLGEFILIESNDFDVVHIVPDENEDCAIFFKGNRYRINKDISNKLNFYGYILVRGGRGWKIFIPFLAGEEEIEMYLDENDYFVGNRSWIGMKSGGSRPGQGVSFTIGTYTE